MGVARGHSEGDESKVLVSRAERIPAIVVACNDPVFVGEGNRHVTERHTLPDRW